MQLKRLRGCIIPSAHAPCLLGVMCRCKYNITRRGLAYVAYPYLEAMRRPDCEDERGGIYSHVFFVSTFLIMQAGNPATSNYQNLSSKMEPELLFFNSRDQLLRLDTQKIVYFEADGNLTYIVLANKLKATVSMNLSKMEEFLALQYKDKARLFMRIGKRFIINMNYIYSIQVARQKLILSDYNNFTFQLPVSKDALRKMKELLLIKKV